MEHFVYFFCLCIEDDGITMINLRDNTNYMLCVIWG